MQRVWRKEKKNIVSIDFNVYFSSMSQKNVLNILVSCWLHCSASLYSPYKLPLQPSPLSAFFHGLELCTSWVVELWAKRERKTTTLNLGWMKTEECVMFHTWLPQILRWSICHHIEPKQGVIILRLKQNKYPIQNYSWVPSHCSGQPSIAVLCWELPILNSIRKKHHMKQLSSCPTM